MFKSSVYRQSPKIVGVKKEDEDRDLWNKTIYRQRRVGGRES